MITSAADALPWIADLRAALPRMPIAERKIVSDALAQLLLDLDLEAPQETGE